MSRRVRHFAALLAVLLATPALAPDVVHAAETDEPAAGEAVLVQLKLQHAGKTHEHPGYMAVLGEETILELTSGEHTYEVSIQLEKKDGKWMLAATFRADGTEIVSGKNGAAKPKSWIKFSKGKDTAVSLRFDPTAKRTDEVELPGGNGPLDGAR